MTIWILHQELSEAEEHTIGMRGEVLLPFNDLPDLTRVQSPEHCRQLLQLLHPDAPPETINRHMDYFWGFFSSVTQEDLMVVPLPHVKKVAVARVTGSYRHHADINGKDIHTLPVSWYEKRIPYGKFRQQQDVFLATGRQRVYEMTRQPMRTVVQHSLPHGYNRFTGFKWLLGLFFLWRIFALIMRMNHTAAPLHLHLS